MINSKEDLTRFLASDKKALYITNRKRPKLFGDEIWKFQIYLRKLEYYNNCKTSIVSRPFFYFIKYKYHRISIKLGFSIPINVFDEGLSIAHRGTIIVNGGAVIGKNCRVHAGVNLGTAIYKKNHAPVIGDNVYIGPGVKIFGKIKIASNIKI
ncbi:serine acetyltransferase [Peribacillus simplex]|uniref:serine acetyltransferase n=1 Tax=Peribacillus simplex TaxID=1478 RepID=UPI0021AA9E69|nr:serine acetyltransferase [Peribacillus simplex]